MTARGPWTIRNSRRVYENAWLVVDEHDVLTPRGAPGLYGVVSPRKWALGVVPFTPEGRIVLVGQYRFPLGRYSWEIPEGGGEKETDPRDSIARELREETGYRAAHWAELLRLDLSNSLTDETAISFLAWGLEPGPAEPDETEALTLREVRFAEALDMVLAGAVTDAISVASLLMIRLRAERRELPEPVLDAVLR